MLRVKAWTGSTLHNTLQMAGVIHPPSRTYIQGTVSGLGTFKPN